MGHNTMEYNNKGQKTEGPNTMRQNMNKGYNIERQHDGTHYKRV